MTLSIHKPAIRLAIAAACLLAGGCNEARSTPGWVVKYDTIADTVVVVNESGRLWGDSAARTGPLRIVYRSDDLAWPGTIVYLGKSRMAVSDRNRIHLFAIDGQTRGIIGRAGSGPGEFKSIGGLMALPGDSLLVLDMGLRRLSWIDLEGNEARAIVVTTPSPALGGLAPIDPVLRPEGIVLAWYTGYVSPGGPPPEYALVLDDYQRGRSRQLAHLTGFAMIGTSSGIFVPRALYGARPLYAVAADGRLAIADGLRYCILVVRLAQFGVLRVCRSVEAPPVQDAIRVPDFGRLEQVLAPDEIVFMKSRLTVQEFPERKNAIQALLFDNSGRLWVRRTGADEVYDPMVLGQHPELRPKLYEWDVFDNEGRLLTSVGLPSLLRPELILGTHVFGVATLDSGEEVVAAVDLMDRRFEQ